jgi:fructose-1,6-bisphosphatase II
MQTVDMDGVVVIGEGEKDEAPMLYNGERIGNGVPPEVDIAVDPIDGTTLLSLGRNNAISVVALSERGTMFNPGPCVYMEKIAVGRAAAGVIDIEAPVKDNLAKVAKVKGIGVDDLVVIILDRPRHDALIREVREAGARIKLITDGDIAGAIMTCVDGSPGDILYGIGGTPEGVTSACALKCFGGEIQGRLWPRPGTDEAEQAEAAGYDLNRVLTTTDLVAGDDVFFAATGITDGELLDGIRFRGAGATSHSLVMRSRSGTIRWVRAEHDRDKLRSISSVAY